MTHRYHTLTSLVLQQTNLHPERPAVVSGDGQITYRQLADQSIRIARWLVSQGLHQEEPVVLLQQRHTGMIVDLMAVLLAGGAWVPVSPDQPIARIRQITEEIKPRFILSGTDQPAIIGSTWVGPSKKSEISDSDLSEIKLSVSKPENLAYILFTSGSTGTPKGVMVEHRSVVSMLEAFNEVAPLSAPFNGLSVCPYIFDVSVWEFFSTLCYGGTLHLADPEQMLDIPSFAQYLKQQSVNSGYFPPGILIPLGKYLEEQPEGVQLNRLLVGVEPILGETLRRFANLPGAPVIINGYGPTEATICATFYRYDKAGEPNSRVPIGKPLRDYEVLLLNDDMQPVPDGTTGQIAVGGAGLARGYFGHPDLTARKFVILPKISNKPFYLTGDFARVSPDGNLVFGGRNDFQVKIHGHRVELSEIEAALETMPGLAAVAASLLHDENQQPLLMCYYEPQPGFIIEEQTLRKWLTDRLPAYMLPHGYCRVDSFPRTVNGKIDREALPVPEKIHDEELPPQGSGVSQELNRVWKKVLGRFPSSPDENFFGTGGDSLRAMHFAALLSDATGVKATVRTLFDYPTPRLLSEFLEEASPSFNGAITPYKTLQPDKPFPLAFTQQRPWLLFQLGGNSALYNLPLAYRIHGPLDTRILEQSLKSLINRNEALRLSFSETDGKSFQRVLPSTDFALVVETIPPGRNQEKALQHYIQNEAVTPFDPSSPPLFRASLVKLDDRHHVLVMVTHHLVMDGWSLGLFHDELEETYNATIENRAPDLRSDTNGWTRFVSEQQYHFTNNDYDNNLKFFERYLKNAPQLLQLPSYKTRPAVQTFNGDAVFLDAQKDITDAITSLAASEGVSSYMVLMATFGLWLQGMTRADDFITGTMTAARQTTGNLNTVGFFSESLPVRFTIPQEATFSEWLRLVKENLLEVTEHQEVPFELLLRKLNPQRDLSYNPVFQVMLVHQRAEKESFVLKNTECTALHLPYPGSKLDLTLYINEYPGKTMFMAEYNTDLFDRAQIEQQLNNYLFLLEQFTRQPSIPLSEAKLINDNEAGLLSELSGMKVPFPEYIPVTELIKKQVLDRSGEEAIIFGKKSYTYQWLWEWSSGIAAAITSSTDENASVALLSARSPEAIAALLGIFRSGRRAIPLSGQLPQARLDFIMNDARVGIVITDGSVALPPSAGNLPVVDIRSLNTADFKTEDPAGPERPAYCIYTSGTSGNPKGVVVTHGGLSNFIRSAIIRYGMTPSDRMLQFASLTFDASVEEIWSTWCSGATLVVREEEMISSPDWFMKQCDELGITVLDLPTAYFHHLAGAQLAETIKIPQALRLVILGGEALQPGMIRQWQQLPGGRPALVNTYGPTETTVVATWADVSDPLDDKPVLIGKPVPGNSAFIVDNHLRQVGIGVTGELLIGGKGVAEGYLNQPELTGHSFIQRPFAPGMRVYRTGDLVRMYPDGNMEFIGRTDDQLKIRGFRVEPAEVETVIASWPGIRDIVVGPAVHQGQGTILCCWYVAAGDADIEELKEWIGWQLPEFMVPSAWVKVDALPLTSSGKIDRRQLPAPDLKSASVSFSAWNPDDPLQKELSLAWSQVLGSKPANPDDNFFLNGGHSLLGATLIATIKQQFGIGLSLRDLFANPTFAGIERLIRNQAGALTAQGQQITPHTWSDEIPLSSSQHRIWFLEQLEETGSAFSIPLSFRISGPLRPQVLNKALDQLIASHIILRSSITTARSGQPVLQFAGDSGYPVSVADLSGLDPASQITEVTLRIQRNEKMRFDTGKWPLFRVNLIKLRDDDWYLILNFHHLVADNRSVGLFVEEISRLYSQLLINPEAGSDTGNLSYTDYIHWQRQWLETETAAEQLERWRQKLADAPLILPLPADRPRPLRQSFEGDEVSITLTAELTQKLREVGAHRGAGLSAVLLSCFSVLLSRYSGQNDFVIGVPVAGRTAGGSDRIMGVTINNLPVRIKTTGDETFSQHLGHTQQMLMDALSLQEIPFEQIVRALKLRPDMSTTPVFQVLFNMLNAHNEELRIRGCSVEFIEPTGHTAKYDLSLIAREKGKEVWITFEYARALFDQATIKHMSRAFLTIAGAIASSPGRALKNISLLNRSDEWHPAGRAADRRPFPRRPLTHLFNETAARHADETAVIAGNRSFTYGEISDRVQMLASTLYTVGCNSGSLIGVMVGRSEWLPVTLLAVHMAGGVYVPLDPVFPPARLAAIVEDAGIGLFLVSKETQRSLPSGKFRTIIVDDPALKQIPRLTAFPEIKMSAPAYIIYTSGSTGQPKGVQVSHTSLTNFLWSIIHEPGMTPGDRMLAVTTISFDIAALELFVPLISGATLVITTGEEQHDARLLSTLIEQHKITIMQATPATWRMMMLTGWQGSPGLTILCGGEALPRELAAQLLPRCKALWNMYGPTETTIWSSLAHITHLNPDRAFADLGQPVANNFLYVTDEYLHPVPPGVPGELLIGGEGVAIGYFNRPELTDAKFLPDPFDPTPGARLYRTGDLVKRMNDGTLEYIGRNDFQIKLRGFRIEPGEIEAILARHPKVEQAVVVMREDRNSVQRLVAYLLRKNMEESGQTSLKDYLAGQLPDYMIPSGYVWLDKFPLTANGKIDRSTLPVPEIKTTESGVKEEPPRNAEETMMLEIWRDVLNIDKISATDDFFDLGGNSLMAVSLMARIELHFKIRLPLSTLFRYSTLRSITEHIRTGGQTVSWRSLVTIRPMGDKPPLFLIHGAGLNVLLYNTLVTHMPADQPVYALQAKGLDGKEKPLETIEEIASHYISEIRTVSPLGPFALAGFSLGGIIAFEMARQLEQMGMKAFFVGMFDTVAYTSDRHLSEKERRKLHRSFMVNQLLFNLRLLYTDSWSHRAHMAGLKFRSIKRAVDRFVIRQKESKSYLTGDRDKLQNFALPVHEVNNRAGERYQLRPSAIRIDLFKAGKQTFYIGDPKTYGWSAYTTEGVAIHEVPGEHNTIFHPPHDKQFAVTLQRCIDEAFDRYLNRSPH